MNQAARPAVGKVQEVVDALVAAEVMERRSVRAVQNGRPAEPGLVSALRHMAGQALAAPAGALAPQGLEVAVAGPPARNGTRQFTLIARARSLRPMPGKETTVMTLPAVTL